MKRDAKEDLKSLENLVALTNFPTTTEGEAALAISEALPYWIKRAQEAEEMLKEILPAAKYLSQRYDTEDNKLSIWTVMVAKINEFLGTEPCDK